jgi:hypothetical protein
VPVLVAVVIPAVDGRAAAVAAQAVAPVVADRGLDVLAGVPENLPAEREAAGTGQNAGNAPSATTGAATREGYNRRGQ